ncbi:YjjW family glycine radical enzyme activase [Bacillus massiliigorillae]|uniref:YjjW family glycine radical enzyme activase n=1 Tax=Bacillus massiliigorillae TaxID=1243664 RepID=UPI00039D8A36|nr:YjjW family glycine radical enzyme activase [Bacillus massiliigorillae]
MNVLKKSNESPINRIIPISTVDGPGARTAVFLQQCNIGCLYCHNPETQKMCRHCGACVKKCSTGALMIESGKVVWNKELCIHCDTCIQNCPNNASPKVNTMTASELMGEIQKNIPFIRGITVSGGECSLYPQFLTELFQLAQKASLTCLMDSNGMVDLQKYPELMKVTNGVMLDIKAWDVKVYQRLTKASSNKIVKKNLKYLANHDLLKEIRIVYVPDYVDANDAIEGIASIIKERKKDIPLKLISFRNHGVRGPLSNSRTPTKSEMLELKNLAEIQGFENITIV